MITYNVDSDGIATLTWDMPGRSMNVLNEASMTAYAGALEQALKDDKVKGIILASGKDTFIAGADLEMLLGADTFAVEVAPNPDKNLSLPVHQIALVVNGIFLLENLNLNELAARRWYEFAFVVQPLKIKGGTGSTVAPVAVSSTCQCLSVK